MPGERIGRGAAEQAGDGHRSAAGLPASRTEPDSAVIRVLSYNVRSMRDDRQALARVIRAGAPDVVCLQEAPRFFRWRKHAARLASDCGLVVVTGGATAAGPMILSSLRAHVERTADILLPRTPHLHRRGLATAVLRFGRVRLQVVSCHLSLDAGERFRQAGMVLDHLQDAPGRLPAVVGGDLNDRPDGGAFGRLAAELQDCWAIRPWGGEYTSPAGRPEQRIDAVLASEEIEVLGCGVPTGLPGISAADLRAATDHLPVLAALQVPAST